MNSDELLTQIVNLLKNAEVSTPDELSALQAGLLEEIENIEIALFGTPDLTEVEAEEAVVEVQDIQSGRTLRRKLPLYFRENENGLYLRGENFNGTSTEIVFLSGASIEKIKDLTGKGLDKPRCDEH